MKYTPILTIFLLVLSACSSKSVDSESKKEKLIKFSRNEFEISVPETWVDATESNPNVQFVMVAPPDSNTDQFTENVTIVIQEIDKSTSIKNFLATTEEQLKTYLPDYVMIKKDIVKKNGVDCLQMEYQATQNGAELRYIQESYLKNGVATIVTFTVEQVIYDTYVSTAKEIFNSFKLK